MKVMNKIKTFIGALLVLSLLVGLSLYITDSQTNAQGLKEKIIWTAQKIQGFDLSAKEAMFYEKLGDNKVQCHLCFFECVIPSGGRGNCQVRANVKGTLRALTYGKPVAVHVDPIEKKPLYNFVPKSDAFSIATVGCNLGCIFCQNWQISQALPEKANHYNLSPKEVVKKAKQQGCEAIAYTYTEPTVFYEYMYETAKLAHKEGIKNLWITCGFIQEEPLRKLCKYMDAANVDFKGYSKKYYLNYSKAPRDPVMKSLKILREEGVWVEVTNLLVPGGNDDSTEIRKLAKWVHDSLGKGVPLHFSRFSPHYKLKNKPPTPMKTMNMAYDIASDVGLEYVYLGNVPGTPHANTYCPNCGKLLVKRRGYNISGIHINKKGRCEYCGEKINGFWSLKQKNR